jgi:hypothetical protein
MNHEITKVFQPEVYAIKVRADKNIKRDYWKWNIYIVTDSQVVIKALNDCTINSNLVWDCHQSLMILDECNNVQFLWVPGHKEIDGNKIVDQLPTWDSLHQFIGSESACSMSDRVVKQAITDRQENWQSIPGQRHAKASFLSSLPKELLS